MGLAEGILYDLAKFYKTIKNGAPSFCTLLSEIGTPSYKLAKNFVPILSLCSCRQYYVMAIVFSK